MLTTLLTTVLKGTTTFAGREGFFLRYKTQVCLGIAARKFLPTDVHGCGGATQLLRPSGQEGQRQPRDAERYFGSPAAGFEEAVGEEIDDCRRGNLAASEELSI